MLTTVFALVVIGGFCLYVMTGDERIRLAREIFAALRRTYETVRRRRADLEPFYSELRGRTAWPFVTFAVAGLYAATYLGMLFGAGALGEPATLMAWGASFGPRTTNGEWWRLATAMFVHGGFFWVVISLFLLVQAGLVVERLIGSLAFAAAYFGAGLLAALVTLARHPLAIDAGATGALAGIYGVLLVTGVACAIRRSPAAMPLTVVKRCGIAAALLVVCTAVFAVDAGAVVAAFGAGVGCGLIMTVRVGDEKAPVRRVAGSAIALVVAAAALAWPLHAVTDIRPEVARVISSEDQTAQSYGAAVDRFRKGRIPVEALIRLIDRTIVPELDALDRRLRALDGVPPEHRPLLADAEEYVHLRLESWRLRSEGLRTTNMAMLGKAEGAQRTALNTLDRIRHAN